MPDLSKLIEQKIAQKQLMEQLAAVDRAEAQALAPGSVDPDTSPPAGAAVAIALTKFRGKEHGREQKANQVYQAIEKQCQKAQAGDLDFISDLLVSQCHSLNTVFNALLADAALSQSQEVKGECLRLAIAAQNQCLKSARAIAEIKSPKRGATFVKTQNNLNVLEVSPDGGMDTRAAIEAGPGDQTVEALAKKHRAKVARGQV